MNHNTLCLSNMEKNDQQHSGQGLPAPICSPVVAWQKGMLRVHDKDDLDCTDVHLLTIDGRTVLRAIVPVHGLGEPVSDADRKLIGQALSEYLANLEIADR